MSSPERVDKALPTNELAKKLEHVDDSNQNRLSLSQDKNVKTIQATECVDAKFIVSCDLTTERVSTKHPFNRAAT